MAERYTPEEIQEIFDRYNAAIRAGIPITDALAREFADATKGVKDYTRTLNASLKMLGQASKQAVKDMADGAKGTSVFNNSIEATGNTLSHMAMQFGVLGKGIGLVIGALTFFITAATKQGDKLFETFQGISRSGAVGGRAMTDVFQSMKGFGYTIDELDKMSAMLSENSKDFALFSGTAATGGKRLEEMVHGFRDFRANLQALGLSTDEQVRAAAGYYKQMGRLGRSTDATSAGAIAYIKEMEKLTRLTGLQRKEIEDQRQAAEDIDQFYAALMDMDPTAAQNAYEVFTRLMSVDPSGKKARAFAVSMDGIIHGSEDQMQSLFATSFQLLEFAQAIKEGRITADQYLQLEVEARKQNIDLQQQLAKVGITDLFGQMKNAVIQVNNGLDPFTNKTARATGEVEDLAKGADAATKAAAKTRINQIDLSNNIQSFVNLGVLPATRALEFLTGVVENLTSLLPGAPSKGYGKQGTGTKTGSVAATATGALAGAATGLLGGPAGVIAGGIAGGLTGYSGYQLYGGGGNTKEGLRIKSPESTAGGEASANLYALAHKLQRDLGSELIHFSAFNDSFHQGTNSVHTQGRALDFTIKDPTKAAQIAAMIRTMPGVSKVLDEYTNPSSRATAGHLHAEINAYAGFRGRLSGPMSGYNPNVRMHGDEEFSIRPSGATTNSNSGASEGTMVKLIERVDNLIDLSRSQLYVNEKMLAYQQ